TSACAPPSPRWPPIPSGAGQSGPRWPGGDSGKSGGAWSSIIYGDPDYSRRMWRCRGDGLWRPSQMAPLRPGARMRGCVDPEQRLGIDLGIALGGRQRGMAEQFLDGAQIATACEEMRREAV